MPPNMRHQPYQGYGYPPHMGGPMPQYPPQYFPQQWYPHQHMPPHMPPPPRQYQTPHAQHQQQLQPYQPLVVSSYPVPPTQQAPVHVPPQPLPPQTSPQIAGPPPRPFDVPFSPPPPSTPSSINNVQETPPASSAASNASDTIRFVPAVPEQLVTGDVIKHPFVPPLPWISVSEEPFPPRAPRRRRKIVRSQNTEPVEFPTREEMPIADEAPMLEVEQEPTILPSDEGTPQTSVAPSENDSTQPTTPSSAVPPLSSSRTQQTPTQSKPSRSFAPAVPIIPALPTSPITPRKQHRDSTISSTSRSASVSQLPVVENVAALESNDDDATAAITSPASEETSKAASPPRQPKSWADLVRSNATAQTSVRVTDHNPTNIGTSKVETMADVLTTMSTDAALHPAKLSFLEPKGLVNTGNMCYMNSILQILTFCIPFYEFLDRVSREAVHTFKSETPLIDAMILFMKEYAVIDSATSVEQLRLRLKQEELEQYGDSFIPENVYEVIRQLPRFRDMRRGHQQDAQEFLGFLLEELHEECALTMKKGGMIVSEATTPTAAVDSTEFPKDEDGWLEVGHKQKSSTTRSSGVVGMESPITKIFGGKLRSELRIPGTKQSNTVEPYQSLQLDIGSPQVNNIVDALKGLSKPEAMQGEFNSPRGKVTATKQVYIEELPPVLILHLKRFQYDNTTKRTEKIWKKVGYPLELEMPREAFPAQIRNKMFIHGGLAKYRLTGVIYHHGRNANGGHYTVDVRRQDGREWIRLDDTLIRRIRNEDVAEGGSEEDPKILAAALERHKRQSKLPTNSNIYEQIHEDEEDEQADSEKGWSHVNGTAGHSRSKSTIGGVNGILTPVTAKDSSGRQTPSQKYASAAGKDSKVAYLLFYQKISGA